jgi:hypothetical protein
MPAIIANAPSFLQNSDYPFDKVILLESGSRTLAAATYGAIDYLPHGLPFTPLLGGNWSLTADFAISYEFGMGPFPATAVGQIYDQTADLLTDGTNVQVVMSNYNLSTSKTIYYRVFGLQPSTDNSDIPTVVSSSDGFTLSTDFNNTKVYLDSYYDLPGGGGAGSTTTITHNLGYIPQTLAWRAQSTLVYMINGSNVDITFGSGTYLEVNTTSIKFYVPAGLPSARVWYRVYLDT